MKLTTALRRIKKETIRRWQYINCGGCCVFASIVGEELLNKGVYACGLVAAYHTGDVDIEAIRHNVRTRRKSELLDTWQDNGIQFNHVGLEIHFGDTVKHYDTNAFRNPNGRLDGMRIYKGRMTINELKALASVSEGWNDTFNRRHIPQIRKYIKSEFAGVTVIDAPA